LRKFFLWSWDVYDVKELTVELMEEYFKRKTKCKGNEKKIALT
jgi:hypothetical protein